MSSKNNQLDNKAKALAIIQGPIISYGQKTKNYCSDGFNVINTIIKNIETLNKLNIIVVVSTWEPKGKNEKEIFNKLSKKIPKNNQIIYTKEPTFEDLSNRFKQQLSTINGLKFFKKYPPQTPTFKLRTDQEYHKSIIEYCLKSNKKDYIVSEILDFPYYLGDFLHYSTYKNLENFFLKSIAWGNQTYIHPATVQDLTIKNIIINNKFNQLLLKTIFGKLLICILSVNKWSRECSRFHALPFNLYFKILWRGEKISDLIINPPLLKKHDMSKVNSSNIERIKFIIKLIKNFFELYLQIVLPKKIKAFKF